MYEDNGASRSEDYNQALEKMMHGEIYKANGYFWRWYNDNVEYSPTTDVWSISCFDEEMLQGFVWILQKEE